MADENPVETPEVEKPKSITDEELRAAFAGPAFHSNKMYVSNLATGTRIAFMEQHGKKVSPQFRTAIILAYPDAIALRDLLTRQLKDIEPEIEKAKEEAIAEAQAIKTPVTGDGH